MQRAFALALSYVLAMPVVAGQLAATSASERTDGKISVIPTPMKAAMLPGIFTIRLNTVILVDKSSPDALNVGQYLADLLSGATGYKIKVSDSGKARRVKGAILLSSRDAKPELGEEGYTLVVGPESVIIRAPKPAGLFYGVQTLRQLLPPEIESRSPTSQTIAWRAPCVQIEDQPRFRWRGLLVDSARHFFPKESLKRFIELMALHKFNVLQIHFTDDQSWTLEIGALPKLTKVGAFGGPYGIGSEWLGVGKGIGSGRYYSKDDVRELVRYAAQRHITIVPEIEMPAHAASWLASYPELLCASHAKFPAPEIGKRGDATQRIIWATYRELCPSNEATYEMAGKVLAGVAELFPSGYLHIGGDEAAKLGWQNCNRCQAKMKTEGLQDVKELQSYFIKRTARIVERQGRKLVGWDEIMEGGLAPNAIVMSWRGVAPGQEAVRAGHDVIFSPTSHCYFDYTYERIPTQKTYSFEPLDGLGPEHTKHVLGVQGNLWSERIADLERLEYMAFPRACALAEVAWSPRGQPERNWQEFRQRLSDHLRRLDVLKVNYCRE